MDGTRLTSGEFDALIHRIGDRDFNKIKDINFQVGNLEEKRHFALMYDAEIEDSKIMATASDLCHALLVTDSSIGIRGKDVKVPKDKQGAIYEMLQRPERIYEVLQKRPNQKTVICFVKNTEDGNAIKIVLEQRTAGTALRIVTMGYGEDDFDRQPKIYKKIQW